MNSNASFGVLLHYVLSFYRNPIANMLATLLSQLASDYKEQCELPFGSSYLHEFARDKISKTASDFTHKFGYDLKSKVSLGAGNWATIPWLGFFDPIETESATKGIFVVILVNPNAKNFILSLNQGATTVFKEHGKTRGCAVLANRAKVIADRIPNYAKKFSASPINLASSKNLPLGYQAGHAFGRTYEIQEDNEEALSNDLDLMFEAYRELVNLGGLDVSEVNNFDTPAQSIEETRKYQLSLRIERSTRVRKSVLEAKTAICECCGLDPKLDYKYNGPQTNAPLDVHHAVPLKKISLNETRTYSIPNDFMVLCPSCHRMIHKLEDESDLSALKATLNFELVRKAT